jgi:uncharacterized protein YecT (DUF1311 family)
MIGRAGYFMSFITGVLIFFALPIKAASADDACASVSSASTLSRSQCYAAAAAEAQKQVLVSYREALSAIQKLPVGPGVRSYLIQELKRSQRAWTRFMQAQCAFDAESTLGSGESIVLPMCQRDMAIERARHLHEWRP